MAAGALRTVLLLCLAAGIVAAPKARAEEPAPRPLTLDEALDLALQQSDLLRAARAGTEALEAQLDQAEAMAWPHLRLEALLAPTPGQRGNALKGFTDYDDWGVFARGELSGYVPLFGFGKIRYLKRAAQLGVEVGRHREAIARAEVRYRVIRAWHALGMARELREVLDEGRGYFDQARKHVESLKREDDPSFDPVDEMKIRVYDVQVRARELEAARGLALAEALFREVLGTAPGETVAADPGPPTLDIPVRAVSLEEALAFALENRPEMAALRTGIRARKAEAEARKRNLFPDFVLAGRLNGAYTSVADNQPTPFADDPWNGWGAGAGLALRWDLEIGRRLGEWRAARAGTRRLEFESREAERGIRLEVERCYREMQDARELAEAQQVALKAARGWVVSKLDLYENGLATLRDVMEGLVQFFQTRLDLVKATYEWSVSVAALERASGLRLFPVGAGAVPAEVPTTPAQ